MFKKNLVKNIKKAKTKKKPQYEHEWYRNLSEHEKQKLAAYRKRFYEKLAN